MGSVSQQGRGSPLYALGSVISYAFFFLLNLVFIKVMKTFLKGYCCCGKIRVEMCQEHFLHIQNFYLLSYPVFPCDPFSLLSSSFAEQFLIFFFCPVLSASFCLSQASSLLQLLFMKQSLHTDSDLSPLAMPYDSFFPFRLPWKLLLSRHCVQPSVPHTPRRSLHMRGIHFERTILKLAFFTLSP